ncbi:MAG: ATP synthase F1 subunit epsilon [Candidatus Neomarinimicrobiota bacterium]|jgi:F-type H+-transporting ATPase subunit epsilon|nr:ATP synthase F1 subunit epsilon [Candidatus Neomarinimicrobiota bacterium]MBQ82191.1 ATP synthase F1 subunit epsilon [Gammaproteobacteria bacterium]MEC7935092.1 ATP synthase F1 subunit epsilon [Candidatus Neomarinimicrobiota bacterium]MEC9027420.1 ATP synthase F1 subunit epsilon [Candidatus Neomarinimicrobiota bacterium]MED5256670.1 ATP synthase F1 subunit epsilon [Candidatus Neomarinimicrobiota bacterium]|tara:strand:- start:4670 stop:5071 length:402 start_codon:yes stop_codon:yes gene_type:complete
MNHFTLDIVTPTQNLDVIEVDYVRCPGIDGSFGIMANHQDGVFSLDIGEIMIQSKSDTKYYSTSGGFAEINENEVCLLVETIELSSEIDISRAESALQRANERKNKKNEEDLDEVRMESSLSRALNRLRVAKR